MIKTITTGISGTADKQQAEQLVRKFESRSTGFYYQYLASKGPLANPWIDVTATQTVIVYENGQSFKAELVKETPLGMNEEDRIISKEGTQIDFRFR